MRARHGSRFVLGLLLGLAACTARATAVELTVEEIPTPRPAGWAVDLTHTLPPERLAELNQLGDQIKEKTGAEMAVVVVSSTGGADSHEFATRLFNTWGIGERGKGNGLLVFAALADHKAEIVLGTGLDGQASRRESEAVMQGEMVPRFRAGNPAGAIVLGAIACARRILHVSPIHSGLDELGIVPETAPETTSYAPSETPAPVVPYSSRPEAVPEPYAQTPHQARDDYAEPRGGAVGGILVFFSLLLVIVGRIAFWGYTQGRGMETGNTWANRSYEDRYDRYDRFRERLEEERTTASSSAAASWGAFSSDRSSSSSPPSDSSSGSSSGSSSSSGFSGGSSSGGRASGSW